MRERCAPSGRARRGGYALPVLAASLAATAALVVVPAAPACAHTGGGNASSNYQVAVRSVPDAVRVQVGVGGRWVRLWPATGGSGPVEVLGYRGEPFLR